MRTIYVIIGSDGEFASIDKDCVFNHKADAEEMLGKLQDEYPEQFFALEKVIVPEE